jgi:hypothetical protein
MVILRSKVVIFLASCAITASILGGFAPQRPTISLASRIVHLTPMATLVNNPSPAAVSIAPTPDNLGYWTATPTGVVQTYGDATFYGDMSGTTLNKPVVGIASTPDGRGYWMVASDGGIFSFGDAQFYGSMGGHPLNQPVVGMAATPDGRGYWMVASDGGIFTFGDAQFYGSMGGHPLNKPIVGMAATPDGKGYWMVASDGGIFTFGNAQFYGSMGGHPLNKPVVGMAATGDGGGYWLVASDGGIFTFGNAQFYGSSVGVSSGSPVMGMAPIKGGVGYWVVQSNGQTFSFGSPSSPPTNPVAPTTTIPPVTVPPTTIPPVTLPSATIPQVTVPPTTMPLPSAPGDLVAIDSGGSVLLSWVPTGAVTSYLVYRNSSLIATIPGSDTTYVDASALQGVTYTYYMVGVSSAGSSPNSNWTTINIPVPTTTTTTTSTTAATTTSTIPSSTTTTVVLGPSSSCTSPSTENICYPSPAPSGTWDNYSVAPNNTTIINQGAGYIRGESNDENIPALPANYGVMYDQYSTTSALVPIRWNPCEVIHPYINLTADPTNGPTGADATQAMTIVENVLAAAAAGTGMTFAPLQTTTATSTSSLPYGSVLFIWPTNAELQAYYGSTLPAGIAGLGGPTSLTWDQNQNVYLQGEAAFDTTTWQSLSTDSRISLVLHEFGHVLGLDHSSNPSNVMYPYLNQDTAYTNNDLQGLANVGLALGCLPAAY